MKTYDPITYRYPRSMDEAFGERGPLVEKDAEPEMDWEDKVILWAAPVVVIFLIMLFAFE